jgi:hypothetical protein
VISDGCPAFELKGTNGSATAKFPDGMYEAVQNRFCHMWTNHKGVTVDRKWAIAIVEADYNSNS